MSVPCSGGVVWHALLAGLPALAVGSLAAWALGHGGGSTAPALAVVALVALAAWPLTRVTPVVLAWDGQRWTADGVPGGLGVMVDVGAGLLLRLRPEERRLPPVWIAVGTADAGAAMHALRAAAYARVQAADRTAKVGPDGLRLPR